MHTAKTILLLRKLSPAQFRKLGKMVRSPFFTTNPGLESLYKYLQPLYPAFESPKLEKEKVFQKIFPKHAYSDIKLRNLLRELTKLIEDLLIYYKLESEEFERRKMLAEIYQEQQLGKLFERELAQLRAVLTNQPYRDDFFYEASFKLNILKMEHIQSVDLKKRAEVLNDALELLNHYHYLTKLGLEAEQKVFSKIWVPTQEESTEHLGRPLIFKIYEKIIELLEANKLDHFFSIKEMLFNNLNQIRPSHQLNILLYLINFAISKMRLDDQYYNNEVFKLYKLGFENGILSQNGHISDHTFLNTCVTGAKYGDFNWVSTYIKNYNDLLSEISRNDLKNLGLSYLYFHQGKFTIAIELLEAHQFTNPLQYISARIHALRCYFEIFLQNSSYLELLLDQTFAFEKLIRRRNNLNDEKRQAYFNFTQFLRQLAKQRALGKLAKLKQEQFQKTLDNQRITMSKSWLLEKIKS